MYFRVVLTAVIGDMKDVNITIAIIQRFMPGVKTE